VSFQETCRKAERRRKTKQAGREKEREIDRYQRKAKKHVLLFRHRYIILVLTQKIKNKRREQARNHRRKYCQFDQTDR
jgi:hypothetical protein